MRVEVDAIAYLPQGAGDLTAEITDLATRAEQVVAGVVNSATRANGDPLTIAATEGAYVTDLDGKRYLDYHAAFGAILLGHHDPVVDEAVIEAIRTEPDLTGWGTSNPRGTPRRGGRRASSPQHRPDGHRHHPAGEAVASRHPVSRAATGRQLLVKFQGCYHGWHDTVVSERHQSPRGRAYGIDPTSAGILPQALVADRARLLQRRCRATRTSWPRRATQVAAVILEPVIHTIGCVIPTAEFLAALRADHHGGLGAHLR